MLFVAETFLLKMEKQMLFWFTLPCQSELPCHIALSIIFNLFCFSASAVAGLAGAIASNPIDVVKVNSLL